VLLISVDQEDNLTWHSLLGVYTVTRQADFPDVKWALKRNN
jgi:hypothetical protein